MVEVAEKPEEVNKAAVEVEKPAAEERFRFAYYQPVKLQTPAAPY